MTGQKQASLRKGGCRGGDAYILLYSYFIQNNTYGPGIALFNSNKMGVKSHCRQKGDR